MNSLQHGIYYFVLLLAVFNLACSTLADDDHLAATAGEQEIQKWIELLGAPSFTVRQDANRKLLDAGIAALPQLRRVADHPDRELGFRVQRLIDFLDRVTLRQQVDAFLEADDPEKFGMPCWSEYAELMKDETAARLVFADMLRQEMELLKKIDSDANADCAELLKERLGEIQERTDFDADSVDVGTICALCFCVCRRDIKLDRNHQEMLYRTTLLRQLKSAVAGGERKDAIRRLITLAIIDNDQFRDDVALRCGSSLELPSIIPRAKRIAAAQASPVELRQAALWTIGELGEREDIEFLERHFDDATVSSSLRKGEFKSTLGDIAVHAAIKLSGRNRDDFGIDPDNIFADEQQRQEIRDKFARIHAEEKAKEAAKRKPDGDSAGKHDRSEKD